MPGLEQFDVVIVGGGAAGCVLAARLSETGTRSILLLEAGPDLREEVPDQLRDGWRICREYDWGYESEPDARGEVEPLRRGKLLGGTSWQTRFALRGSTADYEEWPGLGHPDWRFEDVAPYFARLEADADFGDQPWHGDDGPLPVTRYLDSELTEVAAAGLEALEAVGFPQVDDHNRPGAVGAGRMPMSSHAGRRVTTADAYLPLGGTPPALVIRPETQVAEVVIDGMRAAGVRLVDGTVIEAGEVVLCAGTYASPAILMRSGIGPADHLRSFQIPVRLDLPGVGAGLADHSGVDIECGYSGPGRSAPILHLMATFHSSGSSADEAPDLMLWLSDPEGDPAIFEIAVMLMRPLSRGSVRLRSADPSDPPRIDLPGVCDRADVDRLAEGFLRALDVAARPEIRRLCPAPLEHPSAGELTDWIAANAYPLPHVSGTCAMGSVVDASGSVQGTEGLRVVDASIIPNGPSAFTHLPTIMLAERLSERIA
ncbi:MAG TPA: GMC oxidoreductase [Thermoleophilaceae bacterium]|jgi:choline dehydrogenase